MVLRPARPEDAPALTALIERAFAPYVPRIGRRPAPMDADHEASIAAGLAVVAEEEAVVVGAVIVADHPDHVEVGVLAVDPRRQGSGIGRALLVGAEARARERGTPELRLHTNVKMTENLVLYPRLGFAEVNRRTVLGFDRVFFSKRL